MGRDPIATITKIANFKAHED